MIHPAENYGKNVWTSCLLFYAVKRLTAAKSFDATAKFDPVDQSGRGRMHCAGRKRRTCC
ncbi:hypothetical protein sos41_08220 [Alphaproteobacteria bacterium SO-S41]|nr:hypothetical protein sos41_08220 [Alphaproteobacteria bacterium SO-S41]